MKTLAPGQGRPWRLRALLFFYGHGNLLGCVLALLGPALLFAGVIGPLWGWITAGLYGAGYLLGHAAQPATHLARHIEDSLTLEETLAQLDDLVQQASPHLRADMQAHLGNIRNAVAEVLPRLLAARTHDANLYTVRETVLRYLPETLSNYLALPPAFRRTHVLKEGKTAQQLLGEQLNLLDEQLQQVVAHVANADAQALLANGRFLEAKFRQPDFLAP